MGHGSWVKSLLTLATCPLTLFLLFTAHCSLFTNYAFAEELNLQQLIGEAIKNNPEILSYQAKTSALRFRIPQAKSLPDPMFMFGYQNEGTRDLYTFGSGMAPDSQWMFSATQMFPFPGKLSIKGRIAEKEAESQSELYNLVKLRTAARIKELYYDLFFTYKNITLVRERETFFSRIEEAAMARYSSGMAPVQEVVMAQTEKYMLREKEEMLKQKIQSIEAMLNTTTGRAVNAPLGRPAGLTPTGYNYTMEELLNIAFENSPDIKAKKRMIESLNAKVEMTKREYYPDFTITAGYFARSSLFPDMWSLTTAINIPLFYKTKQRQAVLETEAELSGARYELEAAKLMLSSAVRDNYSMLKTSERLMELYKNGLIPKTYQDFELALAGYVTGKTEAITVISRLKSLIDYETLYWGQFTEREKAIARLDAITTIGSQQLAVSSQEKGEK